MRTSHPVKGREVPGGAKYDRLLHLLILIQGGPPRSANELAELLGVSRRSLFRYLQSFEECSVPYFHDETARGYRIRDDFFLRPPALTVDEAGCLARACARRAGADAAVLATAWSKIAAVLPRHVSSALGVQHGDSLLSPRSGSRRKMNAAPTR